MRLTIYSFTNLKRWQKNHSGSILSCRYAFTLTLSNTVGHYHAQLMSAGKLNVCPRFDRTELLAENAAMVSVPVVVFKFGTPSNSIKTLAPRMTTPGLRNTRSQRFQTTTWIVHIPRIPHKHSTKRCTHVTRPQIIFYLGNTNDTTDRSHPKTTPCIND